MESPEGSRTICRASPSRSCSISNRGLSPTTLAVLQPDKLQARLTRLHQEIEAGSPRPEFELQLDPLGVVAPALKPFAGNAALEQDQPLTSPDRTMRIFLAVTNQPIDRRLRLPGADEKSERLSRPRERGLGRRRRRSRSWSPGAPLTSRKFRSACGTTSSSPSSARSSLSVAFSTSASVAGCRSSEWDSRSSFAASSRSPPGSSSFTSSTW